MLVERTWPADLAGQTFNYLSEGRRVHMVALGKCFQDTFRNTSEIKIWTVIHSGSDIKRGMNQKTKKENNQKVLS